VVGHDFEIVVGQGDTMDSDQVWCYCPLSIRAVQRREMVVSGLVSSLGQVEDHLLGPGDASHELVPVDRFHIGDMGGGSRKLGVTGGLDITNETAEMGDQPGGGRQRDPLAGGGTAQQATHLDEAHHCRHHPGLRTQDLHGPGDQAFVIGRRRT
jgi:hypothetical protein